MDISISWLDRSMTTELEPGETATARRVFTLAVDVAHAGFVVERAPGPSLRGLIVAAGCWFPVPAEP
jgi:hypothetical protein